MKNITYFNLSTPKISFVMKLAHLETFFGCVFLNRVSLS